MREMNNPPVPPFLPEDSESSRWLRGERIETSQLPPTSGPERTLVSQDVQDVEVRATLFLLSQLECDGEIDSRASHLLERLLDRGKERLDYDERRREGELRLQAELKMREARFRFERILILSKLGAAALVLASGVTLALNGSQEIGLFMLGGGITLIAETVMGIQNAS
jgi:hypothetical protein